MKNNQKQLLITTFVLFLFNACSSTQKIPAQRPNFIPLKEIAVNFNSAQPQNNQALTQLSASGMLGIGNTAGDISLISSRNFLKIRKDTIEAYLPYFGSRQGISKQNNLGAIEIYDTPENFNMTYKAEKRRTKISFSVGQKNSQENYDVLLYISNNRSSTLTIISNKRDRIGYRGKATALKKLTNN